MRALRTTRRGPRAAIAALSGTIVMLASTPAFAGQATVSDPTGDTQMMRGGPDIVSTKVAYTGKRITATITYSTPADVAYARDGGTITGVNLKLRKGKTYVLQRHAADAGWQTPLINEIIIGGTAKRVPCNGVTSSVAAKAKQVTVSAPVACFATGGKDLKAQGFSFTVNFDVDETKWTKWIPQG